MTVTLSLFTSAMKLYGMNILALGRRRVRSCVRVRARVHSSGRHGRGGWGSRGEGGADPPTSPAAIRRPQKMVFKSRLYGIRRRRRVPCPPRGKRGGRPLGRGRSAPPHPSRGLGGAIPYSGARVTWTDRET